MSNLRIWLRLFLLQRYAGVSPDKVRIEHPGHDFPKFRPVAAIPFWKPFVKVQPYGLDIHNKPFDKHDSNVASYEDGYPTAMLVRLIHGHKESCVYQEHDANSRVTDNVGKNLYYPYEDD